MNNIKYSIYILIALFSAVLMVPSESVNAIGDIGVNDKGELTGLNSNNEKGVQSTFSTIFQKYRLVIAGVSGVVALSMLLFFIVQAFRLGNSAHNPSERQKAMTGLIWTGIATALLGSISLFVGLFYNMLK